MTLPLDLAIFLFIGLFTPGPNVIMLFSSGARFGFRATLPHLMGVVVGVGLLGFLIGIGIGGLIFALPALEWALKLIAFSWILWLAYGIWRSATRPMNDTDARPMRFWEAVLFQAVNPKFWTVALGGTAYLIGRAPLEQAFLLGGMASAINLFVCLFWARFGQSLSFLMQDGAYRIWFLRIMALLLACSGTMLFF